MSRQVALGKSQNNRRLQRECQTEDCARQCFQDDWQAPTVFSRLCFREPEAGARKARIFLSWHPTKRQVDGGRDECSSSPVVRRRKPKREDGGKWEEGSLRQQWRQWRDVGYRLRCGFYRLVMFAIPFHRGCFLPSVPIDIIKTQSTIYSGKSLEKE